MTHMPFHPLTRELSQWESLNFLSCTPIPPHTLHQG